VGWAADELFAKLENGALSPLWRHDAATRDLAKWIALHERDKDGIRKAMNWQADRPLVVDPLPMRISGAFADYLWGEDPVIHADNDKDQPLLETIVAENDVVQGFWDATDTQAAEGETYYRIYVDKGTSDVPILDWHSRSMVVPLLRGKNLVAAAFISRVNLNDEENYWSYVEVHEKGEAHNRLYVRPSTFEEGNTSAQDDFTVQGIGEMKELSEALETQELTPVWQHGLPFLLAGRIPYKLTRDPRMGMSVYMPIEDLLYDLSEAHTVDSENYRLAGKKRAVMPERFANEDGRFATGEDIFFTREGWEEEMESGDSGPFKILEYSYDGASAIARKEDLAGTCLTRVGLTRVMVDPPSADTSGNAPSGEAWKQRLIPTALAAKGLTRRWDRQDADILYKIQLVDRLGTEKGGFDRKYAGLEKPPTVTRGSIIPEDEDAKVTRLAMAYGAGLISLEEALKQYHPRWTDKMIADEAVRIREHEKLPKVGNINPKDDPNPGDTG
jgi:hypothetical protein